MDSQRLYQLTFELDRWVSNNQSTVEKIEERYSPRGRFNAWRNSPEGKAWKKKQYVKQEGICPICSRSLILKDAQIDHIKPLSAYPDLVTTTSNLQLVHADCNQKKSNREEIT